MGQHKKYEHPLIYKKCKECGESKLVKDFVKNYDNERLKYYYRRICLTCENDRLRINNSNRIYTEAPNESMEFPDPFSGNHVHVKGFNSFLSLPLVEIQTCS